ncbi:MAG: hypothetical protein EOP60_07360 [Sphingomonadales bacterium]|nr:MAG: hypothetical protein EOP60_07360 [Sphingomonadales bacterium]
MFGILLLFSTAIMAPAQDACPNITVSPTSYEKGKATFSAMFQGGDEKVQISVVALPPAAIPPNAPPAAAPRPRSARSTHRHARPSAST